MKHLFTLLSGMIVASSSFAINLPPLNPETSFTPVRQAESRFKGMRAPAKETAATLPSDLWGFNCEPYTWLTPSANGCTDFGALTEFSGSIATALAGKKITKLGMVSPVLMNGGTLDLTLYITYDPEDEAIAEIPITTSGCPVTPDGYIDEITYDYAELPEPITIEEGTPFYVGIKASSIPPYTYPVSVDYVPYNGVGMIMKSNASNGDWYDYTGNYGCACFYIGLDEGPENMVRMMDFAVPTQGNLGETFNTSALVINLGRNDVESATFNIRVGEQDEVELTATGDALQTWNGSALVGGSLRAGLQGYIDIKDIPLTTAGQLDVLGQFVKVNGEPNGWENSIYSGSILVMEPGSGFPRTVVVEEGTGTWCGWCPRGIVMMEYLAEKYPDTFARIAIHSGDQMQDAACVSVLEYLGIPGYPFMFIDRTIGDDPGVTGYFDEIAANNPPAILGVSELSGKYDSEGNVGITSSVTFTFRTDNSEGRYRMSYYITEDNVGPYNQTNKYAGGGYGKMGGWETKGSQVETIYNEVARVLVGDITGIENSIPQRQLNADRPYPYYTECKLAKVTTNPYYLTAFIIDNNTGAVVNAKQVTLEYEEESGLTDAAASKLAVRGINGAVEFAGEYTSVAIYNVAGQLVATAAGESTVALPAGLYIIKADNKVSKVIVK